MSIYAKLQKCRVELQNKNLKKSGNNKFAGYDYYELGDFLPTINTLMNDNKMCSVVAFTNEIATLTLIDTEDNSTAVFTSPMAQASLKGCHDIQNLGAVQTYQRRYLYMNAFEIVEHDALDATTGNEEPKGMSNLKKTGETIVEMTNKITEAQAKRLFAIAHNNAKLVESVIKEYGYEKTLDIKKNDYEIIAKEIEQKAS